MLHDALLVLWFFLPAAAANGVPVLAAFIPGLKRLDMPMDLGLTLRGRPLFGRNKTWRGLIAGIISATAVLALEQFAAMHISGLARFTAELNFVHLPTLLLGPALGAGALIGDAVESMLKRQIGIAPGKNWFPFDQTDFIFGAILFSLPFVVLTGHQYVYSFIVLILLHVTVDNFGEIFHLKSKIHTDEPAKKHGKA